jgi:hypothetical protein
VATTDGPRHQLFFLFRNAWVIFLKCFFYLDLLFLKIVFRAVLEININSNVSGAMWQAQKALDQWRVVLNDQWNTHGILGGVGYGIDGQPLCTRFVPCVAVCERVWGCVRVRKGA